MPANHMASLNLREYFPLGSSPQLSSPPVLAAALFPRAALQRSQAALEHPELSPP